MGSIKGAAKGLVGHLGGDFFRPVVPGGQRLLAAWLFGGYEWSFWEGWRLL